MNACLGFGICDATLREGKNENENKMEGPGDKTIGLRNTYLDVFRSVEGEGRRKEEGARMCVERETGKFYINL